MTANEPTANELADALEAIVRILRKRGHQLLTHDVTVAATLLREQAAEIERVTDILHADDSEARRVLHMAGPLYPDNGAKSQDAVSILASRYLKQAGENQKLEAEIRNLKAWKNALHKDVRSGSRRNSKVGTQLVDLRQALQKRNLTIKQQAAEIADLNEMLDCKTKQTDELAALVEKQAERIADLERAIRHALEYESVYGGMCDAIQIKLFNALKEQSQ